MRGSNPRLLAHKTNALTTELMEHCGLIAISSARRARRHFQEGLEKRQRRGSNPRGQSPLDFKSNSLTSRTHCHFPTVAKFSVLLGPFYRIGKTDATPGRIRTCNLRLRRATPYPLGHRSRDYICSLFFELAPGH